MSHLQFLFAAINQGITPRAPEPEHRFTANDMLIVITAALAVGLLLVIWAVFFRKKTEEKYEYPQVTKRKETQDEPSGDGERRRRRKRRRVRDHRPRNPTLHQTGGLPPPRSEDQPPPY
jgi:hypothetical protein